MIKRGLFLIILVMMVISFNRPVNAEKSNLEASKTEVSVIFNKSSFEVNERVDITFNLQYFKDLIFFLLRMEFPTDELAIIKSNNHYFQYDFVDQIFGMMECQGAMNFYYEESSLFCYIVYKFDDTFGYTDNPISFCNRLGVLSFITKVPIENIYTYFDEKINMIINLRDINYDPIGFDVKFYEKIQYQWTFDNCYDVGQEVNNVQELYQKVVIFNRDLKDVDIKLDFRYLDINRIGEQVVLIHIKDYLTKEYVVEVAYLLFVDRFAPTITGPPSLIIEDQMLALTSLDQDLIISDNYCNKEELIVQFQYWTIDNELIANNQLKNYLQSHKRVFQKVEVIDSSNNVSEPFWREIKMIDTTPPVIPRIDSIELVNDEALTFELEEILAISDNYDPQPLLILSFFDLDGQAIDDYQEELSQGRGFRVEYFGQDEDFNQTPVYELIIRVVDTIKPTLTTSLEIYLEDDEITSFNPLAHISYDDNFGMDKAQVLITFYEGNQTTIINEFNTFKDYLYHGTIGYIKYEVRDNAGNESEPVFQKITPIDLTAPVITVINVESGVVYSSLESIEYIVSDNFKTDVEVLVTLNGFPYNGESINEKGNYQLLILARDQAGNESQVVLSFEVKPLLSGDGAIIQFINEYFEYIIGGLVVLIVSAYVVVALLKKNKGVPYQN